MKPGDKIKATRDVPTYTEWVIPRSTVMTCTSASGFGSGPILICSVAGNIPNPKTGTDVLAYFYGVSQEGFEVVEKAVQIYEKMSQANDFLLFCPKCSMGRIETTTDDNKVFRTFAPCGCAPDA